MTGEPPVLPGRAWPDLLAGPAAIGAMVLMLVTLPVTLLVGWKDDRRLRAVSAVTRCRRCGTLLGPDAPAISDAAYIAALADMQRQYPHHLVHVGRHSQARCPTCGADYVWDRRRRMLHLLLDLEGASDEQVSQQAREERRCEGS